VLMDSWKLVMSRVTRRFAGEIHHARPSKEEAITLDCLHVLSLTAKHKS